MKRFFKSGIHPFRGWIFFFWTAFLLTGCQDIYTKKADSFSTLSCLREIPKELEPQLSIASNAACIYSIRLESEHENSACEASPNAKVLGRGHFYRLSVYERQREVYRAQINFTSNSNKALQKLLKQFKDDMKL